MKSVRHTSRAQAPDRRLCAFRTGTRSQSRGARNGQGDSAAHGHVSRHSGFRRWRCLSRTREPPNSVHALLRVGQVLGIEIPSEQALDVLSRLDFDPRFDTSDPATLTVTVPTYRHDVSIADDIVEEIARVVGYESLPSTLPKGQMAPVQRDPMFLMQSAIRDTATAAGVSEAITYVTVSEDMLEPFSLDDHASAGLLHQVRFDQMLRVKNPMQSGRSLLRITLVPSLIESVAANLKHSPAAGLFELARAYLPNGVDQLPTEVETLGIVMSGNREPVSLYQSAGDIDFFDLKGVVETVLERAGVESSAYEPWPHPALHPGRSATIVHNGETIGVLGEFRPDVAARFGIDSGRVCVAELNVDALAAWRLQMNLNVQVPRYLPARQDFAIVVDESAAASVAGSLRKAAGPLATSVDLFDVYRGSQLGENKKSLAFRVTFTAPDRTLTDDDLVKVRKRIERSLLQEIGGVLRV